jgi:hypothetical protein
VATLRATVVVDYQNVHLTGHGLFHMSRHGPPHDALVDPLNFGNQLIQARNRAQRPGMDHASLERVLVYRGQPSPVHDPGPYARNQAQKAQWERDSRVGVHLRPLKYTYMYDGEGRAVVNEKGQRVVAGKREKGVDVLCALALVREGLKSDVDLVILASQDTDLEPALDESISLNTVKVETFCWYDHLQRHRTRQLRPAGRSVWNTRLGETEFVNSWDRTNYS